MITLPFWLFLLLVITAVLLILDRILLPGVRWYLRRRVNRLINEVNTRLDIEISPFQRTRKQALVDKLVSDEKVVEAMHAYAHEHNMPMEVAQAKVQKYAREIAPSFNAYIYFRFGYWLAKGLGRLLYRVRVGLFDSGRLQNISPDSSVVLVMNHRSNMDYVLVSFLVAEKTALSYAVGEWARIWPLQTLIKSMGAFFVRRNSRNALYRRVLERYVSLATRAGVVQAVFLEGGLTRDGKLREPRQGFLDYMLRDYRVGIDRDVVLVPVGINYDRVVEDVSQVRELGSGAEKRSLWFIIKTTARFATRLLFMGREKRWLRFGYASVNFGKPVSIKAYCEEQAVDFRSAERSTRMQQVEKLSHLLMQEIEQVIPVLPVALMCSVILEHRQQWLSEFELKAKAAKRIVQLKQVGAPIKLPTHACEGVLGGAIAMLTGRGLVESKDGLLRVRTESLDLVKYYANSIRQWRIDEVT
ncbi:MAG: glycerol-3-phosphate acyltransferase [Gammaproteobacteria bacterium]|nr:glycerol-3-phosphate acyltransferase [Gammaproteobacteria bacterium]